MNPIEKLLAFIWDPSGARRRAQVKRIASTNRKVLELQRTQRFAVDQVRRTQEFVSKHRREG